eukprot:TRINITY_DN424_c0_g2_i1.p1 TRINITY_DN424_c0_g2~~TRINITY_DN424_c0_g2_i1.p1  ORF type:complete len:694 (+),score=185.66 TRINITY_DN424_c0_g2_i1:51-2132(+)
MSREGEELKTIVDRLASPPFSISLSLVEFSSKKGLELLQLMNDIFSEIDPSQKKDLRDEKSDQMVQRMWEFLAILNYKYESLMDLAQFKEGLAQASPVVIYPVLYWMLTRIPELKKRIYLSKFLRPLELPDEFFADSELLQQFQTLKDLQTEFTKVHRQAEKQRKSALNPKELQQELDQLESERSALSNKLSKFKDKNGPLSEYSQDTFDSMLSATQRLRKEQEEQAQLQVLSKEQKGRLSRNEQQLRQVEMQYNELEAIDRKQQDPSEMLSKLKEDVKTKQSVLANKDKALKEKETKLREYVKLLSPTPLTEEQVDELDRDVSDLSRSVTQLTQQRDKMQHMMDGQVSFYRERAVAAEKKKEQMLDKLKTAEDEKRQFDKELEVLDSEMQSLIAANSGQRPKSKEEMEQYYQDVKLRSVQWSAMRDALKQEEQELSVLKRTDEVLRSRDENIQEFNRELEHKQGISGYMSTQEEIEKTATSKSSIDKEKGEKLDEIARTVETIELTIQSKRKVLKEPVQMMQELRQQCESLEAEYRKKKSEYQARVLSLQGETMQLQTDIQAMSTSVHNEESRYHFITCLNVLEQARIDQVEAESKFLRGEGKLDRNVKSYSDMYQKAIRDYEELTKTLRQEQKDIKDNYDKNVVQRKLFLSLRDLLTSKLRTLRQQIEKSKKEVHQEMENYLQISSSSAST